MNIQKGIKELAAQYHNKIVELRRHLHQHPELSFQEQATMEFVARQLTEWGIPFEPMQSIYGLVAIVKGSLPGNKVIALRADMDALPIQETNEVPYKSVFPGKMHACGHDVHTASLLGAAKILSDLKDHFAGTIKFLFQPAEEKLPGGASIMIKEGALENPRPVSIFGQHVHPQLECGKVGFKAGQFMASADELFLTINGKGGHGAIPYETIDPILIASHLITALQQIISRRGNPSIPSVLTFGKIYSEGGSTNIIPDRVFIQGTFRTMDEKWRFQAHELMKQLVYHLTASMGATCDFDLLVGYPNLYNDESLTNRAKQWAIAFLGEDNVVDLPIRLTAEDFSFYAQEMPACFYRLGTGNKAKGITSPVHTSTFDIDESSLLVGSGLMAWLAYKELGH